MKIRCGFVTNSSSSSFIIAFKDTKKLFKGKKGVSYINHLQKTFETQLIGQSSDWFSTYEGKIVSNKEELDDYFNERWVWSDTSLEDYLSENNFMRTRYENCLKHINDGFKILFREVDNSDMEVLNLFSEIIDNKYVLMLEND